MLKPHWVQPGVKAWWVPHTTPVPLPVTVKRLLPDSIVLTQRGKWPSGWKELPEFCIFAPRLLRTFTEAERLVALEVLADA